MCLGRGTPRDIAVTSALRCKAPHAFRAPWRSSSRVDKSEIGASYFCVRLYVQQKPAQLHQPHMSLASTLSANQALPAAQRILPAASQFFPFSPLAAQQRVFGFPAAGCGQGVERAYATFPNGCQRCAGSSAKAPCAGVYADFHNGKDYYNPQGEEAAPYFGVQNATRAGTCQTVRGCLDPTARNFNKLANTHCQAMCAYRAPKVCVAQPASPVGAATMACQCGPYAGGAGTAEQAIYARGARAAVGNQKRVVDWSAIKF